MLTKIAVIREPGYPVGHPAPCYLKCPCGRKPPLDNLAISLDAVTCENCGSVYTAAGWVISLVLKPPAPIAGPGKAGLNG